MFSRFPLGDLVLIAAFILVVILGYIVLLNAVGSAFMEAGQVPFPSQYP